MQPPLPQPDPAFDRLLDEALAPEPMPVGLEDRLMGAITSAQTNRPVLARIGPGSEVKGAWSAWTQAALAAGLMLVVSLALWWQPAQVPTQPGTASIEQTINDRLAQWDDTAQRIDAPRDELDQWVSELAGQMALADASPAFDQPAPVPIGSDDLDQSIDLLLTQWDTAVF